MRYILFAFLLLISITSYAQMQMIETSIDTYLKEGVFEYQNNNFDKALDCFLRAQNAGLHNPDLYYNIANTYYKLNNLPYAIIYYKRVLLLDSSHKLAKKNLDFVLSEIRDRQSEPEENFMANFIERAFLYFSINTLLVITLFLFICITLIIHIQWRYPDIDRTILRFVNIVLLFFMLFTASISVSRIMALKNNKEAVITESTVYVYSGPSESFTRLFTLHGGTILKLHRQESDWTQISTLNGFSGWILTETFVAINN